MTYCDRGSRELDTEKLNDKTYICSHFSIHPWAGISAPASVRTEFKGKKEKRAVTGIPLQS